MERRKSWGGGGPSCAQTGSVPTLQGGPPPKEGLTDYLSLPFQMHLGICEYYLPEDNVSPQLIPVLFCVRHSQMEPGSAGRIWGFYLIKLFPSNFSLRSLGSSILLFDLFVSGSSELP